MTKKLSRRDFLKITGTGAAAGMVLVGCGPTSRYVRRQPYAEMPEYQHVGKSTYYATSCRECAAGCGLIVRTFEGRAIKIEGNPNHPVNRGKICPRGLTAVQGVYNLDRITGPKDQGRRGTNDGKDLSWDDGLKIVKKALSENKNGETAFLLGAAPDHLYDFVNELAPQLKTQTPVRYNTLNLLDARETWRQAVKASFGVEALPYFDIANADVIFSFGAEFLEAWLSPMAYSRGYAGMRKGKQSKRGTLVVFSARQSLTAGNADEWIPIVPGTEALAALALMKLAAQKRGTAVPAMAENVDIKAAAEKTGISEEKFSHLAEMFAFAFSSVAIAGGAGLANANGAATAQAVLALNNQVGNFGLPGGVFLTNEGIPSEDLGNLVGLIKKMKGGLVKTLFIHTCNPLFDLPPALGFEDALKNVPQVISFASFPDETALSADYILPDHTMLESWGYQRALAGTDRETWSGFQPVVSALYNTRSTLDVLISAAGLPYKDEVDYLQQKILPLMQKRGTYTAPEILTFWSKFLQFGGWWTAGEGLLVPVPPADMMSAVPELKESAAVEKLHLVVFPTQLGDGSGANRPWLQETPNPATTAMWNSWVEIHPKTAEELGIKDDDLVTITSDAGSVEAIAYLYPAIRPDTVAIPFGQGHTALGQWAENRGCNPAKLMAADLNNAGDLSWADTLVTVKPTGKTQQLSRFESREGVYGKE